MQAVREERLRHKLPSKAKVYEELAKEFNDRRFASVSGGFYTTAITGGGIKTKITRILDGFKRALVVKRKADDGEGPNNLKAVLTKHCKYFFQLEKFWGDDCNALAPLFIDPTTDDRLGPLPAKDFVTDAPRVVEVGCDGDDGDSGIKEELSSNAAEDPIGWSDLEKDDDEPLQRSRPAASTPRATPVRERSDNIDSTCDTRSRAFRRYTISYTPSSKDNIDSTCDTRSRAFRRCIIRHTSHSKDNPTSYPPFSRAIGRVGKYDRHNALVE
ncbi:hypothetical protein DFQ27_009476 [Actinomortierella ambigua]|uniref:Uncharacterized protein n=1 Tax=Actinomortierella ambigua TaxID=1343610 RepID=A0A9P6TX02_9FUNG|nr:hypothetical protein DFQ27_009476 [Actinomortierella ambigua]